MSPLRVLIVGCGNIAGWFDFNRDVSEYPLTHAGAYLRNGHFQLAACVEPDADRRKAFMKRWAIPVGFNSIEDATADGKPFDVVSICSPTNSHANDLLLSLKLKPKLVFCEKPMTHSAASSELIVRKCQEAQILLAVNYTRRWDPSVTDLLSAIKSGRWGRLRGVVGYYNKGLLNNGSHMLDLLLLLLGPLRVVHVGEPINDHLPDDPTTPAWLETADRVPVQIACGHGGDFAIFELQFVFSKAVVAMEEGGLSWRERIARDSTMFEGYQVLDEGVRQAGGYMQSMLKSVENVYSAISSRTPLASTGESALAAQRLCEQIRHQ